MQDAVAGVQYTDRNQRALPFSACSMNKQPRQLASITPYTRSITLYLASSMGDWQMATALRMQAHPSSKTFAVKPPLGKPWSVSASYSPPSSPYTALLSPLVRAHSVILYTHSFIPRSPSPVATCRMSCCLGWQGMDDACQCFPGPTIG